MIKFIISFIFVIVLCYNSYAQSSTESFKRYSIEQGLTQSSVSVILQDSKGFLWFGTQSGLSKYDGIKFQNYEYDLADTNTISNNWIYSLAEDQNGAIWIGTRSGLNKLNPKTGDVMRYEHNPKNINSIPDPIVYCIHIDKEGFLWFISTSKQTTSKLCKMDPKIGKIICYEFQVDFLSFYESVSGWPMYEDKNNNIWFGSHDGLHIFSKKDEAFAVFRYDEKNRNSLSDNIVTSIVEDKQNILWIGTKNGLNKFNKETRLFTRIYSRHGDNKSLIGNEIASLFIDHRGYLWVGGAVEGLSMYNPLTEIFTNFTTDPKRPTTSISSNSVYSINEDRSNNLWIGTEGNGLNMIDLKAKKFEIYNVDNGISDNMIGAIYEESKKILWIGTWNNGLNILNRETGEITLYSDKLTGDKKLIDDHIHAILKDSRGKIWIGTNKGINIYYPETKKMLKLQDYFKVNIKITSRVNSIIETKNKNIWVGTENGAYYLDFKYNEARRFINIPDEPNSISSNHVYSVMEDSDGEIWITTVSGLNKLNLLPFRVQRFLYDPKNKNSPRSNSIYCAIQDKKDLIWLATSCGLNTYDKKIKTFNYYTKKDGLPSDELYGVIEDNNEDIWITTLRGLSVYHKKTGKIHSYDKADGLQSLEFNLGSMHKSPIDGELFLGGVNGLNATYPNNFKMNKVIPPMVITKITKKSNTGDHAVNYEEGKEIVLTYQDFLVTVEFAALDYTNPEKNSYAYKITGSGSQNEEWVDIGNRSFVSFSNMNPGDYTLTIKGANNDNTWNPKGITLHIIVSSPYWKTIWAFLIYLLIGSTLIFLFSKWRIRENNRKNKLKVEKIEAEKSYDSIKQLTDIGQDITSRLIVKDIINTVYEKLNVILDASTFVIGIADVGNNKINVTGGIEKGESLPDFSWDLTDDRLACICYNNQIDIFANTKEDADKFLNVNKPPIAGEDPESLIYVPLSINEKRIGVITVQSFAKNAYTDYHLNIVKNLAIYISIALDNAQAYFQIESQKGKIENTLTELKQTQSQLIQSEKMAALGQLIAGVAHEINTPLGAIKSSVGNISDTLNQELKNWPDFFKKITKENQTIIFNLLEISLKKDLNITSKEERKIKKEISLNLETLNIPEFDTLADILVDVGIYEISEETIVLLKDTNNKEILKMIYKFSGLFRSSQTIQTATDRASKIVFALKNFAHFDNSGEQIKANIIDGIETVLTVYHNTLKHGIEVIKNYNEIPEIYCFPDELNQVWTNIVHNGIQAMKNNGTLKIDVQVSEEKYICISFSDTGCGIPTEIKEKIFDAFFTTKAQGEGSGLGLDIVKKIIDRHKGKIEVESEPGNTKFSIFIPISENNIMRETDKNNKQMLS